VTGTTGCRDLWLRAETVQLDDLLVEAPNLGPNRPICVVPAVGRSCGRYLIPTDEDRFRDVWGQAIGVDIDRDGTSIGGQDATHRSDRLGRGSAADLSAC
jgi:hypothetical protein